MLKELRNAKEIIIMKLDVELVKNMSCFYSKIDVSLTCTITRGNSTPEQYAAMIDYVGFKPAETNSKCTTYKLSSNAQVETLKREFIRFANSDYGKKYVLDF